MYGSRTGASTRKTAATSWGSGSGTVRWQSVGVILCVYASRLRTLLASFVMSNGASRVLVETIADR
jgi:hypothetical protein